MALFAHGPFDVTVTPQATDPAEGGGAVARMTIDKRFHGPLDATSRGQMLSIATAVDGSAGYVAMERVTGSLDGRRGTFALQHSGTMTRDTPQLVISVVPDSGTGQLVGLTGAMTIDITEGRHTYGFSYALPPEAPA